MGQYVNKNKVSIGTAYDYDDVVAEVAGLLAVGTREDGRHHLADICQAGSINALARCKPFRYKAYNFASNADRQTARASANNGFQLVTPTISPSGSSTPHAVLTYQKVDGTENAPNRLLDFDGYNHHAVAPYSITFPAHVDKSDSNGVSVMVHNTSLGWDAGSCLRMDEYIYDNAGALYYALLIRRGTSYFLLPTAEPLNSEVTQRVFTIVFASDAFKLSSFAGMSNIYPVVFPDMANASAGQEYEITLVASGQKGANGGVVGNIASNIGSPYSLEFSLGVDRKTIDVVNTSGASGITGYVDTTWVKSKGTAVGSFTPYSLNGTDLQVTLTTPSGWSGTHLYVEVKISSSYGYFTNTSTGAQLNEISLAKDILISGGQTKKVSIGDLSPFTIWAATSANLVAVNYTLTIWTAQGSQDYKELESKTFVTI